MAQIAIAKTDLYVGLARAHTAGDQVPIDNIAPNGWGDLVELIDDDQGEPKPKK